jgi:hypothetical protein
MVTTSDLRADIARKQVPIYKLAAQVECHPARLGSMLRGTIPMPPALAAKIDAVLKSANPNKDE